MLNAHGKHPLKSSDPCAPRLEVPDCLKVPCFNFEVSSLPGSPSGRSEPFKGCFPHAFPSQMFRTDLDGFLELGPGQIWPLWPLLSGL